MDFTVTKEPVYVSEVIYDGQAEQGVEFDYILPDYYPDIFKILKCTLKPRIVSYNISGDKLICDGIVYISALYLSEQSDDLACVEHRYTYSKTVDLPRSVDNASVIITPKTDYCTCRAVSGRRIDVRGAVSLKIKVRSNRFTEILTSASGCGIQTKTTPVLYGGRKITAEKQFTVREDIEASEARGTVKAIVSCDCVSTLTDTKVIADKVVLKGEAKLKALYLTETDGETFAEKLEADIPLSQIIDVEGVTEKHTCYAQFNILSCDLTVKQSVGGENRLFGCEITAEAYIEANLEETIYPITDMYSTDYESSYSQIQLKTETDPRYIFQQLCIKENVECADGEPESIIDCRCELSNIACRGRSPEELLISGQAAFQVLARAQGGTPVYYEKIVPFELCAEVSGLCAQSSIEPFLQVTSVDYSMTGGENIEIRAGVLLQGCLYKNETVNVVSGITVDENAGKTEKTDYSLKLYFTHEGEDIWDIAKRYNTSADAIMKENNIEEKTSQGDILLIPMICKSK